MDAIMIKGMRSLEFQNILILGIPEHPDWACTHGGEKESSDDGRLDFDGYRTGHPFVTWNEEGRSGF